MVPKPTSLGNRPQGLHAGGSLPEGPSSPAPGQCPRSLPEPGCPSGLQGGSPQPGSQRNDRGGRGGSWGTEPVPDVASPAPQHRARWSRLGSGTPGLCAVALNATRSSIKLKVPHLNSNRKGRSRGLPGAGLPAPDCRVGPLQAGARGRAGSPQGIQPVLWVAFAGPTWIVPPATGGAANCPGRRLSTPSRVPADVTLYAEGTPNDFSPEIPSAGHVALLLAPVTDWKWGPRQVATFSLPKQLGGRCALGGAAAGPTGLGVSASPSGRQETWHPTLGVKQRTSLLSDSVCFP